MTNMAKLRIAYESEQHAANAWIPVYLVPDMDTLVHRLHLLKHLIKAERFIIIIANGVLASLDRIKKTNAEACVAIRWIEQCIHAGNRYL